MWGTELYNCQEKNTSDDRKCDKIAMKTKHVTVTQLLQIESKPLMFNLCKKKSKGVIYASCTAFLQADEFNSLSSGRCGINFKSVIF